MAVEGKADYIFTNWAKTYSCQPDLFFEPQNVEELAQVLFLHYNNLFKQ